MQNFNEWLNELKDANQLIIVEGKKDKIALEKFKITNIITLYKTSIFQIIEYVANNGKECILLVDLDKEGKRLYSKLKHDLQRRGVKINDKFRDYLFKETNLSNIEGLIHHEIV